MYTFRWLTKRALRVPARWQKSQPLKDIADRLGVPQSTRDVLNASLRATERQFFENVLEHFGETKRDLAAQAAIILGGVLSDQPEIALAGIEDVELRTAELGNLLRYEFGLALTHANATMREFLIREAIRLTLGPAT
jgi:hypothetical protein